ncbi:MMPL family transporter [Rothia nasimurium]|uniref:MMPL family transporter n=1 Tax=Rothia nasimurium TaxID=85336 RepID=UPI003B9DE787
MTGLLRSLGYVLARRARLVLVLWILALIIAGAGALTLAKGTTASYTMPGAEFEKVRAELQEKIPDNGVSNAFVVLSSPTSFTEEQQIKVVETIAEALDHEEVVDIIDPFTVELAVQEIETAFTEAETRFNEATAQVTEGEKALEEAKAQPTDGLSPEELASREAALQEQALALAQAKESLRIQTEEFKLAQREKAAAGTMNVINDDRTVALVTLSFSQDSNSLSPDLRQGLMATFNQLTDAGMTVDYSNELAQDVSEIMGASEVIGLVVALIVLLVTLRTVLAAGLPLVLALIGAGTALALVYTSTAFIGMTPTDPVLALMLGLGVGIDYALLILYRYLEELKDGRTVIDAVATANSTAGHSVIYAGATNIIALSALSIIGLPFLTVMGLAGAFSVALVVLASITLVPACLSLLGTRLLTAKDRQALDVLNRTEGAKEPTNRKEAAAALSSTPTGWAGVITRFPGLLTLASIGILIIAIIPTTSLRLGLPDGSYQHPDTTAYRAYHTITENFGEGSNGPIMAAVTLAVPGDENRLRNVALDVADRLKNNRIESVAILSTSEDNSTAVLAFFPEEGPSTESTLNTVNSMLEKVEAVEKATATQIGLTGQTVANIEISERIAHSVPIYLTVVIALCLILMAMVFRSVLIPIMATFGFLLSTLASFGAVVAVYQWGWLGDLLGVTQPGPILAFLPILLIGILFGLSVDYQIFIVSGMRDAKLAGHTSYDSVILGYKQGKVVVTACGIIMIAVFAGFIFSHLTLVRPIGFALALGVAMDAFLIRTTFIPATMYLLGDAAWWWPFRKKETDEGEKFRHIAH